MAKFPEEALKELFKKRDLNGDGSLDAKEIEQMLKEIFKENNDEFKPENLETFMKKFDLDSDKKVTLEEYIKVLNSD